MLENRIHTSDLSYKKVEIDNTEVLLQIVDLEEKFFPGNSYAFEGLQVILSNQLYLCYAVLIGKKLVGYIIVNSNPVDKVSSIFKVAIAPEFQRQGIAKLLLEYLLGALIDVGMSEVILEVRASNMIARKAYIRAGFVEIGMRKSYYDNPTEDGVILHKKL